MLVPHSILPSEIRCWRGHQEEGPGWRTSYPLAREDEDPQEASSPESSLAQHYLLLAIRSIATPTTGLLLKHTT